MSKKFNIHNWQANQVKQRLAEQDWSQKNQDDWQKRQDALTPGKNPEKFFGGLDKLRNSPAANELSQDEINAIYNEFPEIDNFNYEGKEVIDDPDGDMENATLKMNVVKSYEVLTSATGNEKWWEWGSGPKSSKSMDEQDFDDRLTKQMGMSDDEFEKNVASRDIGDPFPLAADDYTGDTEMSRKASDLIEKLREDYRNMSDEEKDIFSSEMIEHFLNNTAAQARAKVFFARTEL